MDIDEITNEEEALAAVRRDGRVLEYVPKRLKTAEVCLEAVRRDGRVLGFVPDELMTEGLCLEALKDCGKGSLYGPEELQMKVRERITAFANARKHETD